MHILHIQNNSKLFTGIIRRLKKSIGTRLRKLAHFSIQVNSRYHNNKYCKSLLKCHKIWKIISDTYKKQSRVLGKYVLDSRGVCRSNTLFFS